MTYTSINSYTESFFKDYSFYLFDLWGVVHDGTSLYPGILNVFKQLRKNGKKIGFISNAPRRASVAKNILLDFGVFTEGDKIVTSGECFFNFVSDLLVKNATDKPRNVFYIGPRRDSGILDGLDVRIITKNPQDALFGVITGFGDDVQNDDNLRRTLHECLKCGITLFCANPDLVVVRQNGDRFECAGVIAQMYEQLGGGVEYFGKPYYKIYDTLFNEMQIDGSQKNKVVAIGDSISTDITGAKNYGIDSVFCTYGIHKAEILASSLDGFLSQKNARPTFVVNKW